jgi:probable DNA metabolism protein
MNTVFLTDGTWEGYLTALFDAFDLKIPVVSCRRCMGAIYRAPSASTSLFETEIAITTDPEKSSRVWKALSLIGEKRERGKISGMAYAAWCSELPLVETALWRYLQAVFRKTLNPGDLLNADAFEVYQAAHKVRREAHNLKGFVRFQVAEETQGIGALLGAVIEPTYNVLRLLAPHFARRFPNETFLIADAKRRIGIFYDGELHEVSIDPNEIQSQDLFADLWKSYPKNIAIAERKNPKLQRQFLPKKYWKYLTEMS